MSTFNNAQKAVASKVVADISHLKSFVYLASILIIGLCVPWDTPRLADGSDGTARTSPFVILVDLAGIKGLPRESAPPRARSRSVIEPWS